MYIILKNKKNLYFFDRLISKYNIDEFFLLDSNSIIFKFLNKLNITLLGKWKKEIKQYNTFIIFESLYNSKISETIKRNNKNSRVILYFWNYINKNNEYILKDSNINEFWTFDKNDAEKYNMKYNPQFYTKEVILEDNKAENDIVFLGRPKNREKEILDMKNILNEKNILTDFRIIKNEKDYISYNDYLKILSKSKCILDYTQEGQVGLSLRPMEALFLKKKLITNNKDIKNYDFYNPNNIFILGEDNINEINKFLDKPYERVDEKIIKYYDFEQWLKRFEENNNEF